ncbi:MAG: hypothetical protein ACLSUW_09825 [Akkermansia sp.]
MMPSVCNYGLILGAAFRSPSSRLTDEDRMFGTALVVGNEPSTHLLYPQGVAPY